MKIKYLVLSLFLAVIASQIPANAQSIKEQDWKSDTSINGVTIDYHISKMKDSNNKKRVLMQYHLNTNVQTSFEKIEKVMLTFDQHYKFTGDEQSKLIKQNDSEYLVYYFTKASWPIPASDIVASMTITKDDANDRVEYHLKVKPNSYEDKGFRRFEIYDVSYVFEKTSENNFDVTIMAKVLPPFKIPKWMINMAFPNSVYELMDDLVQLIEV